ncbi:MAG TPA: helix-turn-helix domain-containing protein, partial [Candidatus Gracilibacteria bacterium]|nr:helix-turn-helix domain-containing protein [Candidatus Gracilibacteria bacterium]
MTKTLIPIIKNLGLTDKETKVYISLIEVGPSVVSRIAEKARINRVTTYDILEKLKEKGFISTFTKQKIKYFSPTDPEIIANNFDQKTKAFKESLPELKRL